MFKEPDKDFPSASEFSTCLWRDLFPSVAGIETAGVKYPLSKQNSLWLNHRHAM